MDMWRFLYFKSNIKKIELIIGIRSPRGLFIIITLYTIQLFFGIFSLSHPDNAFQVNELVTPLHIVPEWYFLSYYTMLKALPNKNAGFIILLTSILILLLFGESYFHRLNCSFFLIIICFLWIGAQLPQEIFISYGRILTLFYYFIIIIQMDILLYGLLLSGISSCLTSINFIATIINMRCYSMTLSIMPVYTWSINITGFLLLLTLPILTGALIMSLADLHYNTVFFNPIFGGDPVLYQHLFWFFGHPEVYILIIPAFGIISIIISGITQIIIFGNQSMILAMSCICVLGSVVWGHHMYTVGMESDTRAYFTAVTMMISLPTGTKIFNWLCTYLNNAPCRTSAALFTLIFLLMFTIGGSTGVILGNAVVDIALHDTYYVVAVI